VTGESTSRGTLRAQCCTVGSTRERSEQWDHDHCEACTAKFMESGPAGTLTEGYVTADNYRWICGECFRDLKDEMGWTLAA